MDLLEKFNKDIITAMKEQDKERLTVLRMVKGTMQLEHINNKKELNEELLIDCVGKQIKISVSPKNLTNKQMNELETKWTRNYIVEVVDGYNVYSAKELGYINNSTSALPQIGSIAPESAKTVWDRFKEANGLELN